MGIYKRNGTWWARLDGRRFSLRTRDREVAKERYRQAELAATNPAKHSGHTLVEALDAIFTSRPTMPAGTRNAYSNQARQLVRLLGESKPVSRLTRDDVTAYVRARLAEGVTSHTVCKETNLLRLSLREARKRGLWSGDPGDTVPTVPARYVPRKEWLTDDEVAQLIERLPWRRLWLLIALGAGLRLSELEGLRWSDVRGGAIHVRGTKTAGAARVVPIAPSLAAELEAARRPAGLVVGRWGGATRSLTAAMARIRGVERTTRGKPVTKPPQVSANDLRRTYASRLVQAGVSLFAVARLLGHRSTVMVERVYGHLAAAHLREAVDRVEFVPPPPQTEAPSAAGATRAEAISRRWRAK